MTEDVVLKKRWITDGDSVGMSRWVLDGWKSVRGRILLNTPMNLLDVVTLLLAESWKSCGNDWLYLGGIRVPLIVSVILDYRRTHLFSQPCCQAWNLVLKYRPNQWCTSMRQITGDKHKDDCVTWKRRKFWEVINFRRRSKHMTNRGMDQSKVREA
jgi:hypothetical protein